VRAVHIPEFQAVFIFVVNIGVHIAKNANKTEKESGIRPNWRQLPSACCSVRRDAAEDCGLVG